MVVCPARAECLAAFHCDEVRAWRRASEEASSPSSLALTRAFREDEEAAAAQVAFDRLPTYGSATHAVIAEVRTAGPLQCAAARDSAATAHRLAAGAVVRCTARAVLADGSASARIVEPAKGWYPAAALLMKREIKSAAPAVQRGATSARQSRPLTAAEEFSRRHHESTRHQAAPAALTCPCARADAFVQSLGARVHAQLTDRGVAVLEPGEAWTAAEAREILAEARALDAAGRLATNPQRSTNTRDDKLCWIREGDAPRALAKALRWQRGLAHALNEANGPWAGSLPTGTAPSLLAAPEAAMLACYPRDCYIGYKWHRDNDVSDGSRSNPRALTVILYLNEDWDDARDGGALVVYDDKNSERPKVGRRPPLRIVPEAGRVVVFDSFYGHEVLPATRERFALTLWLFFEP